MTDFVYYKYFSKFLTKKLKPEESTEVHQFLVSQVQVYNGDYQQQCQSGGDESHLLM